MTVRKPLALSLIALAIAAPGLASASALYHPAGGEVGMTTHPDHVQSNVSRGDVLQSVEAARKDGTLAMDAVTKTFRYLDEEELAAKRKAAQAAKGGKK